MEEEVFKLKPAEEFIYDLYSNHAMNALLIRYDTQEVVFTELADAAFSITEAMIIERRKRKSL